jgi:hypothetical protein
MSVKMTNELWRRDCEPRRKHLLHAICDCADDDGRAFPSVNYLAWKTDLPRSTINQYMGEFREQRVIEDLGRRSQVEHAIPQHSGADTSVIRVRLDRLKEKQPWRVPSLVTGLGSSDSRTRVVQPGAGGSPADGRAIRKNHHEPSLKPICNLCGNSGTWEQKAHKKLMYCWCPVGVELQKREYEPDGTWKPESKKA